MSTLLDVGSLPKFKMVATKTRSGIISEWVEPATQFQRQSQICDQAEHACDTADIDRLPKFSCFYYLQFGGHHLEFW